MEFERHPTTPAFTAWYFEIVRDYQVLPDGVYGAEPDQDRMNSICQEAIAPLTEKLVQRLGHDPVYRTMSIPSVCSGMARWAIRKALEPQYVIGAAHDTHMCSAWSFYAGENLGRQPDECNEFGPRNVVLVLEYAKEYLRICVNELWWELHPGFIYEKEVFRKDLGTKRLEVSQSTGSVDDGGSLQEQEGKSVSQHSYDLREFLTDYVQKEVLPDYALDTIRAIVVAGEVPKKRATELAMLAREAVGGNIAKVFMNAGDPVEPIARGAARWARDSVSWRNCSNCPPYEGPNPPVPPPG